LYPLKACLVHTGDIGQKVVLQVAARAPARRAWRAPARRAPELLVLFDRFEASCFEVSCRIIKGASMAAKARLWGDHRDRPPLRGHDPISARNIRRDRAARGPRLHRPGHLVAGWAGSIPIRRGVDLSMQDCRRSVWQHVLEDQHAGTAAEPPRSRGCACEK
jgi:hypothetical protein